MCTRDIQTASFLYFKHLKAFSVDHQVNTVEIEMYMRNLTSRFCSRFQDFQHFGSLFSFLIKQESIENLNLTAFEWMNIEDFEMQLIDLKASLLCTSKFSDLRKSLETVENKQKSILTCWESLPEKFSCLKKNGNRFIILVRIYVFVRTNIFSHEVRSWSPPKPTD